MQIFLKYVHACVCIYIFKIIIHTTHTFIKQKLLFWMQLIEINRCPALLLFDFFSLQTANKSDLQWELNNLITTVYSLCA